MTDVTALRSERLPFEITTAAQPLGDSRTSSSTPGDRPPQAFSLSNAPGSSPLGDATVSTGPFSVGADYANVARMVGRKLAAMIPPERAIELAQERGTLVKKKLTEGLSRADQVRMARVQWELDRIEDALIGDELDFLEDVAASTTNLAEEIRSLNERLSAFRPRR